MRGQARYCSSAGVAVGLTLLLLQGEAGAQRSGASASGGAASRASASGGAASPASASEATADPRAVALFTTARVLMAQGLYAQACPKLEESLRIQEGMGTRFNLSDCYEHLGRTASAWRGFWAVAAQAEAAGQPGRAQIARERAASLKPQLARLKIVVPASAELPGLEVRRDGAPVNASASNPGEPVDPGKYVVSASAPGSASWSTEVVVKGPGKVVKVEVPRLEPVSGSADALTGRRSLALPIGLMAGGGTVLAVGVVLLGVARWNDGNVDSTRSHIQRGGSSYNECLASPKPSGCDKIESAASTSSTLTPISVASIVVGATVLGAGVVYLFVNAPAPEAPPSSALRVVPVAGRESGGILVSGSF